MHPNDIPDDPPFCRDEFILPLNKAVGGTLCAASEPCTYLCGNSLGLLSKKSKGLVHQELEVWGTRAVEGHHEHPFLDYGWLQVADLVHPLYTDIIGAQESEVVSMGTLTANLHLMMSTFYKPSSERYKILCEAKAFPSDQYAFASQARLHGLDPSKAILELSPRPGEHYLRPEDIIDVIEGQGSQIALVLFSGVQFYTGQLFPIERITAAAQNKGCVVGWDLAHAVGNVPLQLHDWNVDFAVWCTYKYLNSGPGGIGGLFLHSKYDDVHQPRMAGWWGNEPESRFEMLPQFQPTKGAHGFQQSNPNVLATVSLLGSLRVFRQAGGMQAVRARSIRLTGYLEKLLRGSQFYVEGGNNLTHPEEPRFTIITPSDVESRGAQLSLLFYPEEKGVMQQVFEGLKQHGVIGDARNPDVIRLAPTALYNTYEECKKAASCIDQLLRQVKEQGH